MRQPRVVRIELALAATTLAGCYCSHGRAPDAAVMDGAVIEAGTDTRADALPPTFEGCEVPALWDGPVVESEGRVEIGGGVCAPPQYPVHVAYISAAYSGAISSAERARLDRSCWRVVSAHPDSGWEPGTVIASDDPFVNVFVIGHERPVTFEGRVLRDDGVVSASVPEVDVALDAAQILDADAHDVVAVAVTRDSRSRSVLARRRSVHVGDTIIATEGDVIAAAGSAPWWLERVGAELLVRMILAEGEPPASLSLGTPAEARVIANAFAVVLGERELVFLESTDVLAIEGRVTLPDAIHGTAGSHRSVIVQTGADVVAFDRSGAELARRTVGEGKLLAAPPQYYVRSYFWDGARLVELDIEEGAFVETVLLEPTAEERSTVGEPLAVGRATLIGRDGFLGWSEGADPPGPRAVSAVDLYGGPITLVANDALSYVVTRADGTAVLYRVPFIDWCD